MYRADEHPYQCETCGRGFKSSSAAAWCCSSVTETDDYVNFTWR